MERARKTDRQRGGFVSKTLNERSELIVTCRFEQTDAAQPRACHQRCASSFITYFSFFAFVCFCLHFLIASSFNQLTIRFATLHLARCMRSFGIGSERDVALECDVTSKKSACLAGQKEMPIAGKAGSASMIEWSSRESTKFLLGVCKKKIGNRKMSSNRATNYSALGFQNTLVSTSPFLCTFVYLSFKAKAWPARPFRDALSLEVFLTNKFDRPSISAPQF